jgi:hypothetical protein
MKAFGFDDFVILMIFIGIELLDRPVLIVGLLLKIADEALIILV